MCRGGCRTERRELGAAFLGEGVLLLLGSWFRGIPSYPKYTFVVGRHAEALTVLVREGAIYFSTGSQHTASTCCANSPLDIVIFTS